MSDLAVSVKDLRFSIRKKPILEQINFDVPKACVFAVVGHNGAGKTTLFHVLLGLKIQNAGDVQLWGKSNLDPSSRAELGYVPERPYLNLERSFKSVLSFHASLMGVAYRDRKAAVLKAAESVGLEKHLSQDLSTFSKGMLQKALLAQAVLGDPQILILDEPMSGLDPEARESVRKTVLSLKQSGKTLIFSSHALEDVEQLADRVMIIKAGKIEFLGSVAEWKASR
jgi:ABC-2 type transport system ATP-binding protein